MLRRLNSYFGNICETHVASMYRDAKFRFIYETAFGVQTYVHQEKLLDIIKTNIACDAEPAIMALTALLPPNGIAIDVGANIGIVSCWLAKNLDHVYSFEPELENVDWLMKNIKLNGLDNITVMECVVGRSSGSANLYVRESFGHHGISEKHVTGIIKTIKVDMVSLDDFCENKLLQRISVLKIDVEGSELDVLTGFSRYLAERKIDLIVFEHAPVLLEGGESVLSVYDLLTRFGYAIYNLDHYVVSREVMAKAPQGDFYAKPI